MPAIRHISQAKKTIPGRTSELSVIIPAAGFGKRMKSKEPKLLTDIGGTTLIERQLEMIWSIYPKSEIILVIGYQAERIRNQLSKYPIRFIFNPIYENTNVAFSLGLALQASISKHCLIIYGDLVFNADSINSITEGKSKLLIDSQNKLNETEVGVIIDEKKHISNLAFGLPTKWSQILYLENKELDMFKKFCYDGSATRWLGYEVLNRVIDNGGIIQSQTILSAKVFDIDTPQDIEKSMEIING